MLSNQEKAMIEQLKTAEANAGFVLRLAMELGAGEKLVNEAKRIATETKDLRLSYERNRV